MSITTAPAPSCPITEQYLETERTPLMKRSLCRGLKWEEAEDIVQSVFVRAWRLRHTYNPSRASRRTWLYTIYNNTLFDYRNRRRNGKLQTVSIQILEERPDAPSLPLSLNHSETDTILHFLVVEEFLQSTTSERVCFIQKIMEGENCNTAARELGWSKEKMKTELETLRIHLHHFFHSTQVPLQEKQTPASSPTEL